MTGGPSPEAFEALLRFLGPQPSQAAEQYQAIRDRLSRMFEWRGIIPGEDAADETLDRVARRLLEGMDAEGARPYVLIHGFALNVAREAQRKKTVRARAEESAGHEARVPGIEQQLLTRERLSALQHCLQRLSAVNRELLTAYHLEEDESGAIKRRKHLVTTLELSETALRLRVFRLRRQVMKCTRRRLGEE